MAKAAILGFGTVGSGVYEIIRDGGFSELLGEKLKVSYILDIRDFDDDEIKPLLTKDFNDILSDGEIKVVAEVMGGLHPAYEFTKSLLEKGVSVVTSNKELVATYGAELLEIAAANNAQYMFEASVGGGIPIIRPMTICTKANTIERIAGILNGTTNFILNEMLEKGKSFDAALSDAQAKGYAERNPAADIEGHDACRKLAILSSMAWGKFVDYNDIPTEGITNITPEDVDYARKLGCVIKLIGYAKRESDGRIYARVSPALVSKNNILSSVNGVFNAVMLRGNYLGDAMFYGRGAGKEATASAVVADMLDCARHFNSEKHNILWEHNNKDIMYPCSEEKSTCFVRTSDSTENIKNSFKQAEFLDPIDGENAFVVRDISKRELDEGLAKLADVISSVVFLEE
mgnify:CR=1 FL=1